jgi:DNA-binding response OmpR family regulator
VLVVDEVEVRIALSSYLRSNCGFRVYEAADGHEAVTILSEPRLRVDAVLCDVELSGEINGFGLKQWASASKPGVHFILSGTPKRAAQAAVKLCEQGELLPRPYDPALVEDRIRRLLAATARAG